MKFENCYQFLSSPQSLDFVEKSQTKRKIKKKRTNRHKHNLNTNILLEIDPSKMTLRQRILQQKFQQKKNMMGNLEFINAGLDCQHVNPKLTQYKIRIPVASKLRICCENNENSLLLKIKETSQDCNLNTKTLLEKCEKEANNLSVSSNLPTLVCKAKGFKFENKNITLPNTKDNSNYFTINNWFVSKLDVFCSTQRFPALSHSKLSSKMLKNTQICKYANVNTIVNVPKISNYFTSISKDVNTENEDYLKVETNLINRFKLHKIANSKIVLRNQTMKYKNKRILFGERSKKRNEDCMYKTAFYLSKLQIISKTKNAQTKKCIYYSDILIKTFKRFGCVCKVIGEVKWFIKLSEETNV